MLYDSIIEGVNFKFITRVALVLVLPVICT